MTPQVKNADAALCTGLLRRWKRPIFAAPWIAAWATETLSERGRAHSCCTPGGRPVSQSLQAFQIL